MNVLWYTVPRTLKHFWQQMFLHTLCKVRWWWWWWGGWVEGGKRQILKKCLHSWTKCQYWQLLFVLHTLLFRNYGHYPLNFTSFNSINFCLSNPIYKPGHTSELDPYLQPMFWSCSYLPKKCNYLPGNKSSIPPLSNLYILFNCQVRNLRHPQPLSITSKH